MRLVWQPLISKDNLLHLTYTQAMQEQDFLWEMEQEDFETMINLHIDIIVEAKQKGWTGFSTTYESSDEVITEVFDDLKQYQDCLKGVVELEDNMSGNCRGLIWLLNKHYMYLQKEKGN